MYVCVIGFRLTHLRHNCTKLLPCPRRSKCPPAVPDLCVPTSALPVSTPAVPVSTPAIPDVRASVLHSSRDHEAMLSALPRPNRTIRPATSFLGKVSVCTFVYASDTLYCVFRND